MKSFLSKRFLVGFVVVTVGASIGSAFAMWTSTGTGSGNAKARTATTVTVNAVTGTADLYPGSVGDVHFTLTNTNPYPIKFTQMAAGSITSSAPVACLATLVDVDDVASGLDLQVAANATSASQLIDAVVHLDATAPDGCQGVVFTIALTLTGSQV
jgi:hypothetical protein